MNEEGKKMSEEMTTGPAMANEWGSMESLKFMRQLMDIAKPFLPKRMYVPSMEHPLFEQLGRGTADGGVGHLAGIELYVEPERCALAKALALLDGITIDGPCFLEIEGAYYLVD